MALGFRPAIKTKIDHHGRIVIPADVRRELGLEPGVALTLRVKDGAVQIMRLDEAIRRVQEIAKRYTGGRTGLVDEFIADRRREAERE